MIKRELGGREGVCPRCGMDATWSYAGERQAVVEVLCPDCGRLEVPRAEFDRAESEIVTPEEPE